MRKVIDKFNPEDVIVYTTITLCIIVIATGRDGPIKDILITVTGFYFGKKATEAKQQKRDEDKNN